VTPITVNDARQRTLVGLFLSALLSSPGQTFVFALYIEHLMQALDLSRAQASASYALATLTAAASLVGLSHVADRLRTRALLLGVMTIIAAGMVLMALATAPWHLVLALVLLRLAGQGAVGVSLLTVVVRRFEDGTRGRPLSVATLGYPAGEALFPFAVSLLMATVGWRQSLGVLAGVYVIGALPAPRLAVAVATSRTRATVAQDDDDDRRRRAPVDHPAAATLLDGATGVLRAAGGRHRALLPSGRVVP
jgi:MFS family permease